MRPILPLAARPFVPSRRRTRLRSDSGLRGAVAILLMAALVATPAAANPQGGTVTAGSATISTPTATTTQVIQTTSKAVVDWQSFSIGNGETTSFIQPSSDSITLNRVVGGVPSEILGRLTATGQVWLVNPNGIFFGSSATVDVAGLLATTHDIRNADFMAGRYDFHATGPGGYVINQGNITVADTGLVGLVAPYVANRGIITARLGEVALGSGSAFTVDFYGDQLINLALDQPVTAPVKDNTGKTVTSLVENSGKIFADGGRVTLTAAAAKGVVDKVIDTSGVIQANSVVEKNGEIYLLGEGGSVEVSGTLSAAGTGAGTKGGAVVVTGDTVAVKSTARINVSGASGGGQAMIGGDIQGGKASAETLARYATSNYRKTVPTATKTTVEAGATITADATVNGKGGKIVVWAEEDTLSYGSYTARGGAQGGDGGFIETSGKLTLAVGGTADASAALGIGGYWLLDPTNVTITSSVSSNGGWSGGTFTDTADPSTVYSGEIISALNVGTSVIISAAGSVTVGDAITKTSGTSASLTLSAGGAIAVGQPITSTSNALNVTLEGTTSSAITIGANITTNGGSLLVGASGGNSALSISQVAATTISAGTTSFKADTITLDGTLQSTGNVTLTGHTDIANTGSVAAATDGSLLISDSAAFALNSASLSAKSITVSGTTVDLTGTITQTGTGSGTGGLTVLSTGDVTVGGSYSISGTDAMNVLLQGGDTGTITINTNINTHGGTFDAKGASALLIPDGLSLSTGATITASDIYFQSAAITLNGTLVSTGDVNLIGGSVSVNSVGGGISLTGTLTARGDSITLNDVITASDAGASVLLAANSTVALYEDMTLGTGTLTISNNGGANPNVTVNNVVDITASDVNLHGAVVSYSGHITSSGSVAMIGDTSLSLNAGSGITMTGSNKILTLQSDDIALSGPIGTTGLINQAILSGSTTASTIGLGVGATGTLNLLESEMGQLSGFSLIQVGASSSGGAIQVNDSGGNNNFYLSNLTSLRGTSVVVSSGTVLASAAALTMEAGGVTVDGGILASGDVRIATTAAGLYVNGSVTSSAGDVRLSVVAAQPFQTSGSASVSSGSGKVLKIEADDISLSAASSLTSTSGQVILEPTQATTPVYINSGSTDFNLTTSELATVTTTRLTIGKADKDANITIGNLTIPGGVDTLELSGYGLTFTGTVSGPGKNLWINADGGNLVFSGAVGGTGVNRLGQLKIDPPANITASDVYVTSLISDATGNVTFSNLDATGTAEIKAGGTLSGAFNVGNGLTINTASSTITGSWGSLANLSSNGTTHTLNGAVTTVDTGGGGGTPPSGTDTTSGGTSTTPGGTDTTSGGTSTTPGGTDTTSGGGTSTTPGGTDTTSGGDTSTTPGGTDTTSGGGTDTTSGGSDTIEGGIGSLGDDTDTIIQQVAGLTGDDQGTTGTVGELRVGDMNTIRNDPLPDLVPMTSVNGMTVTPINGGETKQSDGTATDTSFRATTQVSLPLDDTGLPAYSSSGVVSSPVVQAMVVEFHTTTTGSSAAEAVASLAAKDMTNVEVRAVFEAMPAAEVASGLTASSSALGQRMGALLQETLSGAVVTYADVKGVLEGYGADSELARTYLSLFQRVQKEARADLFAGALDQLRQNPETADLFASPPEGKEAKPQFTGLRMSGMTPQGLARIEGKVDHPSPYVQLRVNGHWVFVDDTGTFRADIPVQAGNNQVELSVIDEDGDRTVHSMAVDAPTASPADAMRSREGKRVALLFAAHDYRDPNIPPLVTPKADATLVARTLREKMGYQTQIIDNGTKATMVEALRRLGRELTEADSAIVYYAGHGFALQETGKGYWLPVDAKTESPAEWISNQDVARLLHRMPAKHILLVADSCYSGAFTKEQAVSSADVEHDVNALRQRRSVMAMSSGGDEPVLDGDINSPFATALVGQVGKLQTFEPGVAMFKLVHDVVVQKTPQTPQYGAVRFAGYDPGGDYLFNRSTKGKTVAAR